MDLTEKVARAMCAGGGFSPDEPMPNDGPRWKYYEPAARAAIAVCAEEIAREVEAMLWYVEMTPGHIRAKEPADFAAAIRSMGEKGE